MAFQVVGRPDASRQVMFGDATPLTKEAVEGFSERVSEIYKKFQEENRPWMNSVYALAGYKPFEALQPDMIESINAYNTLVGRCQKEEVADLGILSILDKMRPIVLEMNVKAGGVTQLDIQAIGDFFNAPQAEFYFHNGHRYYQGDHSQAFCFSCAYFLDHQIGEGVGIDRHQVTPTGDVFDLIYVKAPTANIFRERVREFLSKIEKVKVQVPQTFGPHLERWKYSRCRYCNPNILLDMGFDRKAVYNTYGVMLFYKKLED